nr:MFS transporter [Hymenobacter sp. BRD67]
MIGGLSDRFGRRPVLLASLLGLGCDYIFLALAPSIGWLFVGRTIAGITGASFTTATAYIADVSTPKSVPRTLGWWARRLGWALLSGRC